MADTILPYTGRKVLEIGAGMGNMSRHLAPHRKLYVAYRTSAGRIYGTSPEPVPALAPRFVSANWMRQMRKTSFRSSWQMDTVVCLNVLEHIEDDAATLNYLRTLLEPGGRLILLVPNDPKAYGTIDKEIGHYRRYTPFRTLRTLLTDSGYEVETILKFNRVSMPAWRFTGQVRKREGTLFAVWPPYVRQVRLDLAEDRRRVALGTGLDHRDSAAG